MHYYQFNIGDWLLGTSHLGLEEEAIYLRLINHYYSEEKPIPEETKMVIRRLRLGSDEALVEGILQEFFVLTDKGWLHNRCEEMLKTYRKTVRKNRDNGRKGGRPRKDGGCSETQNKPTGNPLASEVEPTGNPNQEPVTTNQEPVTSNQVKKKSRSAQSSFEIPEGIDKNLWNDFMDLRRKLKAQNTERALSGLVNKLYELNRENGDDPNKVIEQSIINSYKGVFPLKDNFNANQKNTSSTGINRPFTAEDFDLNAEF